MRTDRHLVGLYLLLIEDLAQGTLGQLGETGAVQSMNQGGQALSWHFYGHGMEGDPASRERRDFTFFPSSSQIPFLGETCCLIS
jgi:hypothetical protein